MDPLLNTLLRQDLLTYIVRSNKQAYTSLGSVKHRGILAAIEVRV